MTTPPPLPARIMDDGISVLSGVPTGFDAMVLADLCKTSHAETNAAVLHIAHDAKSMDVLSKAVGFFAPDIEIIEFPAWDCLPYDRISPNASLVARRMVAMARLCQPAAGPRMVITTVNAALQRIPSRATVASMSFIARPGEIIDTDRLMVFLSTNGYNRCSLVMEPGDFAVRGGIIDLFPPGQAYPVRLDFFGDSLETIRHFEPETQRSIGQINVLELVGASEVQLDDKSIARFRHQYITAFGAIAHDDPLYESIKAGSRYQGMEQWLPLFHEELETIFDFVNTPLVTCDHLANNAYAERMSQISDYFEARTSAFALAEKNDQSRIHYLQPEHLYLTQDIWENSTKGRNSLMLTPFSEGKQTGVYDFAVRQGRNFAPERAQEGVNVFDALIAHIEERSKAGKKIILTSWSDGARSRLEGLMREHGADEPIQCNSWADVEAAGNSIHLVVLELEAGFETQDYCFIAEQDILGDRLVQRKKSKKAANFLTEAASLSPGDLVVHVDHGVARFEGLETVTVTGAPHDCLKLIYRHDDKLFLPVENIELLSRYGPDDIGAQLDKLGGAGWQGRKARLRNKLKDIADELIKIAAARKLRDGKVMTAPDGLYDEFCTRFAFEETDDQLDSIEAVLDDFASGLPMDRLVCGDVGFGKTEIALRAAFVAAFASTQVAVIAPTTLLARQHYKTFTERFKGLPVTVRELSRLVKTTDAAETKLGLQSGEVDIVIGTHALLNTTISFKNLGLVIVDEEQRFGVTHKERLKKLRNEVHLLTLTATPIPRTMQLALTGVRDLSLISTPPVDRLSIRTFVTPFDQVVIREALLREKYRAGQSFYICPRIADLDSAAEFLSEHVPEVKFIITHGQLSGQELEERMSAFYEGAYDVLLSTSIIESGIDIPTANTMVIHRADMFGLAQLYQMRGRVGRSKTRAYAYITYDDGKPLTGPAEKRLKVLQSLDSLGAGFTLASHDLDLRGAGNLLGEEQSGHVKEVGFELYQSMLEEAVANQQGQTKDETWSPQINIGTPVLLPESYITDFEVRMGLYRRLATLETSEEIESFAAELIDRFGSLPADAENLMKVLTIKGMCKVAGIEKIDVGAKGMVLSFRNKVFPNPEGLIRLINDYPDTIKLRPDHTLLYKANLETDADRLLQTRKLVTELSKLSTG
ncbi:MAG: transcription-repair coupling factor [Parvibaculales bacterium]